MKRTRTATTTQDSETMMMKKLSQMWCCPAQLPSNGQKITMTVTQLGRELLGGPNAPCLRIRGKVATRLLLSVRAGEGGSHETTQVTFYPRREKSEHLG